MIANLEQLKDLMIANDPSVMDPNHPDDWSTDLPTFGGPAPADTQGVWSWDERRLLVGQSAVAGFSASLVGGASGRASSALRIIPRENV